MFKRKHITESRKRATQWFALYERTRDADKLVPCEHGHLECSTHRNGPCMDEVLSTYPDLNERS
jgi:hypothetical protein